MGKKKIELVIFVMLVLACNSNESARSRVHGDLIFFYPINYNLSEAEIRRLNDNCKLLTISDSSFEIANYLLENDTPRFYYNYDTDFPNGKKPSSFVTNLGNFIGIPHLDTSNVLINITRRKEHEVIMQLEDNHRTSLFIFYIDSFNLRSDQYRKLQVLYGGNIPTTESVRKELEQLKGKSEEAKK